MRGSSRQPPRSARVPSRSSIGQRGISVPAVLGLVAVTGIVAAVMMTMVTQQQDLLRARERSTELQALARHLGTRLDCDASMSARACQDTTAERSTCSSGGIALLDSTGSPIAAANGGKVGDRYRVRGCCSADRDAAGPFGSELRLVVEAQRLSKSGTSSGDWTSLYEGERLNPCGRSPHGSLVVVREDIRPMAATCPSFFGSVVEAYIPVGASASCPEGRRAIGAGIDCRGLSLLPIYSSPGPQLHPGSYAHGMSFVGDAAGRGFCCVAVNAIPIPFASQRAELACVR